MVLSWLISDLTLLAGPKEVTKESNQRKRVESHSNSCRIILMSITRKNSWKLKLGIALFLASQLVASAHALEFGDAPHEHHGYACVVLSVDDQVDLVTNGSALVSRVILKNVVAVTPNSPESTNDVALPPAIGPPLSI